MSLCMCSDVMHAYLSQGRLDRAISVNHSEVRDLLSNMQRIRIIRREFRGHRKVVHPSHDENADDQVTNPCSSPHTYQVNKTSLPPYPPDDTSGPPIGATNNMPCRPVTCPSTSCAACTCPLTKRRHSLSPKVISWSGPTAG